MPQPLTPDFQVRLSIIILFWLTATLQKLKIVLSFDLTKVWVKSTTWLYPIIMYQYRNNKKTRFRFLIHLKNHSFLKNDAYTTEINPKII